jgi:hypothetical protein
MIELGPGRPGVVDEVGVVVVTLANDGRSTQELGISYYSALFTARQPSCASRSRRRREQMSRPHRAEWFQFSAPHGPELDFKIRRVVVRDPDPPRPPGRVGG